MSGLASLGKILVANRGEIACRIMRTARKLGIKTLAVYSDADKNSKHVEYADEAVHIGPSQTRKTFFRSDLSYLQGDKIIEVGLDKNCHAVHPGFGFLSENTNFADNCERNNLIFIGPPSTAIRAMGSKSESKKIMVKANVPVVPGYHESNQDPPFLLEEAKKIGFPVLIKAVSGGGGKGMRIVEKEKDFLELLDSCKREALKSFKDENVILEKYITRPRHIEVQVFGDKHGNYVHLHERDCTVQRRHQKVIEESPSSLSKVQLDYMFEKAIAAAKAVNYFNAGTVEFIYDMDSKEFYFMEMNTRLQVEHPVTEMITRQDLVEWQLRVASGEKLPLTQDQIPRIGHSFESRIYAEDPYNDFFPKIGKLHSIITPNENENVRIESGVRTNDEISVFYDPMIAKLIVWGEDRATALKRMRNSLSQYMVVGPENNIGFLKRICDNETFKTGEFSTAFIPTYHESLLEKTKSLHYSDIIAAALSIIEKEKLVMKNTIPSELTDFRVNHSLKKQFTIKFFANFLENIETDVVIQYGESNKFRISFENKNFDLSYKLENGKLFVETKDEKFSKFAFISSEISTIFTENGDPITIINKNEEFESSSSKSSVIDANSVKSPMPGTVLKITAKVGDTVNANDVLVIIEAMKMEHQIRSPGEKKIKAINTGDGKFVEFGQILIEFE